MERSDIPAFPSLNAVCTGLDSDGGERWDTEPSGGMTLRDYFAAKAMQGLLSAHFCSDEYTSEVIAATAYQMADAMLEAHK